MRQCKHRKVLLLAQVLVAIDWQTWISNWGSTHCMLSLSLPLPLLLLTIWRGLAARTVLFVFPKACSLFRFPLCHRTVFVESHKDFQSTLCDRVLSTSLAEIVFNRVHCWIAIKVGGFQSWHEGWGPVVVSSKNEIFVSTYKYVLPFLWFLKRQFYEFVLEPTS